MLLVPFLTSCQEECPITTAALLSVQRDIVSDGLSKKVAIVEVTVDPGRDTPQRMTAYASLTGSSWSLLTGAPTTLAYVVALFRHLLPKGAEGSPRVSTGRRIFPTPTTSTTPMALSFSIPASMSVLSLAG